MAIRRTFRLTPGGLDARVPTRLKNHNLKNTSPNTTQFEPTESSPVRQHAQMAGDPCGSGKSGGYPR